MTTKTQRAFASMEAITRGTSDLSLEVTARLAIGLNKVLADVFSLYVKTKGFHWHVGGPHFTAYHTLLDEQSDQLIKMVDVLAERVRKLGEPTIRSVHEILRNSSIESEEGTNLTDVYMLDTLRDDNLRLTIRLREARQMCEQLDDSASAAIIDTWIDESEKRVWFLNESTKVQ